MTKIDRAASDRLPALDAMRGLVIALMAVDHVDAVVNAHHAQGDSALWAQPVPLSIPDFLTRWSTHLCAPTFVFLAGASIALAARRVESPAQQRAFDLHLLARALLLVWIEVLLVSSAFHMQFEAGGAWSWRPLYLQVISAIGASMLLMIPLRRLPMLLRCVIAVALLVTCELVVAGRDAEQSVGLVSTLLFHFGPWPDFENMHLLVLYPLLPWLAVMLLGHIVGSWVVDHGLAPRGWLLGGLCSLAGFVVLRGLDRFGNMGLHRRDDSWLEWLHCSKYPPSVTYLLMELGLMALSIAAMSAWAGRRAATPGPLWRALITLGRVPMFFYLLHLLLIGGIAFSGLVAGQSGTWRVSWALAAVVVAVCLPMCAAYGRYKRRRGGWTRFL